MTDERLEVGGFTQPSSRGALAAISLSILLSSLGTSSANALLPMLTTAFGAPFQQVQWVVLAYLIAMTSSMVGVGRLGDIFGRRRLLVVGLLLFSAGSLACAISPTLGVMIVSRAFQGIGAAVMTALGMAFVADAVPKSQTGRAMGLLGTMSAIGTALGPSLGGVLVDTIGWPAAFALNLPLGLVAVGLAKRFLPIDPPASQERARFDPSGTVLLSATLALYALATTAGRGHLDASNAGLLVIAMIGAGLFLRQQARASSPLIPPGTLRQSGLGEGLVLNVIVSTVMMATLVVGPFYLSRSLGLSVAAVGMIMAVGPIVSALTGVFAGRVVDEIGAPRAVTMGLAGVAFGAIALAFAPGPFGWLGYIAAIAILTPGYQLFQAGNNTSAMAEVPPGNRGVTSGILNLSRSLGLITGASAMGAVFNLAAGSGDVAVAAPGDVAGAMRITFIVAGLIAGTGLLAASWRQKPLSSLQPERPARDRR